LPAQITGWKPVKFDSKTLGTKCDFTGMLSIETIDGDEAEELLRNLGKPSDGAEPGKKKKKKAKKGTGAGDARDATAEAVVQSDGAAGTKQKVSKRPAADDDEQETRGSKSEATRDTSSGKSLAGKVKQNQKRKAAEEPQANAAAEAAEAAALDETRPKKKQKTQKERKEEKRQRLEKQKARKAAAAAAEAAEMSGEGEEAAEEHLPTRCDADYDDGFEYEEWGGVMLRKCITKALLAKGFAQPTAIQEAVISLSLLFSALLCSHLLHATLADFMLFYPTLSYPTLPYPTLPYPTLPYPTLPHPVRL
jgi:hypothetical protein